MQIMLAALGIFGSCSWAMLQFLLKHVGERNTELRSWIEKQFDQSESNRRTATGAWRDLIRDMQQNDRSFESRLDEMEAKLARYAEDEKARRAQDPPSGFP
ncbi:MAG: hypothetical protein IPL99_12310 [Candidatus Competibacteraceae bacterium]|nr:hypothetical protein [Candidatus Competibacteraceae bacterium]